MVPDEIQKETETRNDGGNRRGVWRRSEDERTVGRSASEVEEEGRERVKEEKAGGGERRTGAP